MSKKRSLSIVVLTRNQLEYTRQCFDSVFEAADLETLWCCMTMSSVPSVEQSSPTTTS